jgi:hypothetical protein
MDVKKYLVLSFQLLILIIFGLFAWNVLFYYAILAVNVIGFSFGVITQEQAKTTVIWAIDSAWNRTVIAYLILAPMIVLREITEYKRYIELTKGVYRKFKVSTNE